MRNLFDLTKKELEDILVKEGGKKFNAVQIFNWLYKKKVFLPEEMLNLPKSIRVKFNKLFAAELPREIKRTVSKNKDAIKYLFALQDGKKIETVLMRQPYGNTLCVSTQIGCAYGCYMCATGQMGLKRNLLPGEITGQLVAVEFIEKVKVNNIVFMGMGEPLANYDNLKSSIEIFSDKDGICLHNKRLTVSTCGLVKGIRQLITDGLKVNLSVSLHSTFESVRNKLVPVNKKHPITELFKAMKDFNREVNTHVTIEYVLIAGVNDGIGEVDNLIDLINKYELNVKVNLIPVNAIGQNDGEMSKSSEETIKMWQKKLENVKIIVTARMERGADIKAACGQLAGEG